jgi:hypothetical protein
LGRPERQHSVRVSRRPCGQTFWLGSRWVLGLGLDLDPNPKKINLVLDSELNSIHFGIEQMFNPVFHALSNFRILRNFILKFGISIKF